MSANYATRVATPDDAESISALLYASYSQLMREDYQPDALKQLLPLITKANPVLLESGNYYVAQDTTGYIVGCGGWSLDRPGDGGIEPHLGHIRHFGTHPQWIKRGIGRQIFDLCQSNAAANGVTRFEAYSSLNGERFYQSLGFERVEQIDVPIGPVLTLPSVLMVYSFQ